MDFQTAMRISASGLSAERTWMNVLSSNLANVDTTKTADGKPYARRTLIFESTPCQSEFGDVLNSAFQQDLDRVKVVKILPDGRPFKKVYEPGNPDADAKGYVLMPNINPVEEMANLMMASRSYQANLAALNMDKQMALQAIQIGK